MTRWLSVMLLAALAATAAAATSVHVPVSTRIPAAQAAFDRGLFIYYAYNREESASAFADSAADDPSLAMALWGEALANGPDLNTPMLADAFARAQAANSHARQLLASASAATPMERTLIAAQALRFRGSFADWTADDAAYRSTMLREASASNDETVQLLAAEALMESDQTDARARTLVDEVLARDPTNPMANHLCLHLADEARDRAFAEICAQRLDAADFPPPAEHLAHVPAHYWIETGNYAKALSSSERAYALLVQLENSGRDPAHVEQYAKHDVGVGYSAAMMLGNYATAQRWSDRMAPAFDYRFGGITALRFARYDVAYAVPSNEMGATVVRGFAALLLGKNAEAATIGKAVERQTEASPNDGYLAQIFLARLAEAQGRDADALRWFERAEANQHDAFGAELIPWMPAGEALGGFYLRRGIDDRAVNAFEDDLSTYPNDPRALLGLSLALERLGRTADADRAHQAFQRAWAGADTTLTPADL